MALGAAIARADHHLYDTPRVFDDAHAFGMLYGHWRWIVGSRFLHWLVLRKMLSVMRPVYGEVVARSRFAEDALRAAIGRGVNQYVILGAGLDTFALREPGLADRLNIFELDQAASLRFKQDHLLRTCAALPPNVEYVAVDFECESVADALSRSRFDPSKPCFLSWLGTTFYLTDAAVFATLRSFAACAAPGSEMVFDYCVAEASLGARDRDELDALKRLAARRGEPFVASFLPAQLVGRITELKLEVVENASPDKLQRRYFDGRADGLRPSRFAWITHLRAGAAHKKV